MSFYSDADFLPDRSMGYLARRVFQLSSIGLEPVFAAEGLNLTQWSALVSIHFERGNTPAELARDLAHDKGATTRLVDGLVERGWVVRTRDADDRRLVKLALTDEGGRIAQHCRSKVIACWNSWLKGWDPADADELVRLLQQLRGTIQATVNQGANI